MADLATNAPPESLSGHEVPETLSDEAKLQILPQVGRRCATPPPCCVCVASHRHAGAFSERELELRCHRRSPPATPKRFHRNLDFRPPSLSGLVAGEV